MLTVKDEVKPWNAPSEDTDPFNWGKEIEEKVCYWKNVLIITPVHSATTCLGRRMLKRGLQLRVNV